MLPTTTSSSPSWSAQFLQQQPCASVARPGVLRAWKWHHEGTSSPALQPEDDVAGFSLEPGALAAIYSRLVGQYHLAEGASGQ